MSEDFQPGRLVRATAGRDNGRWMVITGQLDDRFVFASDGDLRSVKRPKKKNKKHLQATSRIDLKLSQLLSTDDCTDADVKGAIRRMLEEECKP